MVHARSVVKIVLQFCKENGLNESFNAIQVSPQRAPARIVEQRIDGMETNYAREQAPIGDGDRGPVAFIALLNFRRLARCTELGMPKSGR